MAYIVAGLVAGVLLLAEQHWRERLWFRVDALAWWALRVAAEVVFALLLTAVLAHIPNLVNFHSALLLGLVAGLAGPRFFARSTLALRERNLNPINIAYERATDTLDEFIDESSAEAQRTYVESVVRPAAARGELDKDEIAEAFRRHLNGRRRIKGVELTRRLNFITEILDDDTPDDEKVALLVLKAWEIGAYKALQGVLKPLPRRPYGARETVRRFWDKLPRPARSTSGD